MRMEKYIGIALSIVLALSVTGCGQQFPDLTEEEYKQTVEYAAGLLMKYSNNAQERLVYVDAAEIEKQRKKQAAKEAAEQETQAAPAEAPKPVVQPEPEPEVPAVTEEDTGAEVMTGEDLVDQGEGAESGEDTGGAPEGGDEPAAEQQIEPGAIVLSSDESQEITDDIFLSYQGYMVSSTYPESSKSYVVNADKGKKLLVLRFDLYNGSDTTKSVNMIPLNLLFQIILNGKNLGYSSVTFLPNDLSSFSGNIESRAHESVVVLTQISEKEATNIQTLGMIVSLRGNDQTVYLK